MADVPPHFDGKRFYNPGAAQARGFLDVLRWQLGSRPEPSPRFVRDVSPCKPPTRVEGPALRVTLINHSTLLLQQNGVNILTDPIWSERASPFTWIGPRRHRDAGVRLEDIPPIDIVLLSHNHYDHLDLATLRRLAERGEARFVVPLGVAALLAKHSIRAEKEMDWGDSQRIGETNIHCVPAFHFSARGLFDRNRTLWCGFVIDTGGRMVYFAGDTAFGNHFAQIRRQFGAPRLALLPIGAYAPRWFMSSVHMGPEEAVQAHEILGAGDTVAIHHGTFRLGDEALDTPRRKLESCRPADSFHLLNNGEFLKIV